MQAHETAIISADADKAWSIIRDFSNVAAWHQDVTEVLGVEHGPGDRVGCLRSIRLRNEAIFVEKLLALSDLEHSYSYTIVEGPAPVRDYVGTVKLTPITRTGQTLVSWTSVFDPAEGDGAGLSDGVRDTVILVGFAGLANSCAGRGKLEGI